MSFYQAMILFYNSFKKHRKSAKLPSDVTILNSLFGLCLLSFCLSVFLSFLSFCLIVFLSFCLFVFLSFCLKTFTLAICRRQRDTWFTFCTFFDISYVSVSIFSGWTLVLTRRIEVFPFLPQCLQFPQRVASDASAYKIITILLFFSDNTE